MLTHMLKSFKSITYFLPIACGYLIGSLIFGDPLVETFWTAAGLWFCCFFYDLVDYAGRFWHNVTTG